MTKSFSLDTAAQAAEAVAKLFDNYMRYSPQLYAGQYCDGRQLKQVFAELPDLTDDLVFQLWSDAETIAYWVAGKVESDPGEQINAVTAITEVSKGVTILLAGIDKLRRNRRAYEELNENYHLSLMAGPSPKEVENAEWTVVQSEEEIASGVKPRKLTPTEIAKIKSQPKGPGVIAVLYGGDVQSYFMDVGDNASQWDRGTLDLMDRFKRRLEVWRNESWETVRRLERKSSKRAAGKRGAPKDEWSKRAILLLACCWRRRLITTASSGTAKSKIPFATLFRAYVRATLVRVEFRQIKGRDFTRQINEVLGGKVTLPRSLVI